MATSDLQPSLFLLLFVSFLQPLQQKVSDFSEGVNHRFCRHVYILRNFVSVVIQFLHSTEQQETWNEHVETR